MRGIPEFGPTYCLRDRGLDVQENGSGGERQSYCRCRCTRPFGPCSSPVRGSSGAHSHRRMSLKTSREVGRSRPTPEAYDCTERGSGYATRPYYYFRAGEANVYPQDVAHHSCRVPLHLRDLWSRLVDTQAHREQISIPALPWRSTGLRRTIVKDPRHVSGTAECSELISIVPKPVLLRLSRRSEPSDCRLQPDIPRSG